MFDTMIPILTNIDDVKKEIWESDLILVRNRKGTYVRAAKANWWDNELFCVEVRKYLGVTAVSLEQLALSHPGRIDIYEANPQSRWTNYDRQGATRQLKNTVFTREDRRTALWETVRNLVLKLSGGTKPVQKPYGFEAIRLADRLGGGVDPAPEVTDTWTAASDLVLSPFYQYRFTLK